MQISMGQGIGSDRKTCGSEEEQVAKIPPYVNESLLFHYIIPRSQSSLPIHTHYILITSLIHSLRLPLHQHYIFIIQHKEKTKTYVRSNITVLYESFKNQNLGEMRGYVEVVVH